VRPVAISVDPPDVSRNLSTQQGYTFTILSDPDTRAIRAYDLLHPAGRGEGHDIARPAEFLIDKAGVVRWRNLTGDIRVRARQEELVEAARTSF